MQRTWCLYLVVVFLMAFTASPVRAQSTGGPAAPDYWPTNGWRSATPEQQGIDSNKLADALDHIRKKNINIHSLLIIRNGYVVLDAYFHPYRETDVHDIASVTKTLTSTLVGIAIEQGKIKSVQESALTFFPERSISNRDARKERITIEHLLTMTSGLDCRNKLGEQTLDEMKQSADWVQFMLNLAVVEEPGSKYLYCSGGTHLLSGIIAQATGMSELEFARRSLFEPLGIKDATWPTDSQGVNHGWGDLQLHPRDLAKIGYLWLNKGNWDGKRIVSANWVTESVRVHTITKLDSDYGYGWWVLSRASPLRYEAVGRGGQRVTVVPAKNLVVVFTGGGFDPGDIGKLIAEGIKSDAPLSENSTGVSRLANAVETAVKPPMPNVVSVIPPTGSAISGKTYLLDTNVLGLQSLALTFSPQSEATVRITYADKHAEERPIALNGVMHISPNGPFGLPVGLKGFWENKNTFSFDYDEIAHINCYHLRITFKENQLSAQVTERTTNLKASLVGRTTN